MDLGLRQQLKLSQQLVMTPQLQMAIKLLQLSQLELMDTIHQELEQNPALEESMELPDEKERGDETPNVEDIPSLAPSLTEVSIEEKIHEDHVDWSNYIDEYNTPGRINFETERKDTPSFESFLSKKESLEDHLLWQLMMTAPTAEEERIGSVIIGNINNDGYLEAETEDLLQAALCDMDAMNAMLSRIQTFDPVGVGARELKECLLIQTKRLGLENSIVHRIISDHLHQLQNKNYKLIAKALKAKIDDVLLAINIIKDLEPKPGREFNEEEPFYIVPDIYVYKVEEDFVIMMNDEDMPRLQLNSYYQNAMKQKEPIQAHVKTYLKDKIRSAAWLIRSIHQRQKTIYRVMESILHFQREFFEKGILHLKPMVLRDVAEHISMHESTISRVTTNKYAHTPQGIFELKYFFNSSIKSFGGDAVSSASVQDHIRHLIDDENPKKPYSDEKISDILKDKLNIDIARRTVAKYRENMKILSSSKRKQY
ncbi:MAG: RNA polymerase factor sigma-54 [Proteobacteria bacterium]|nr:RNA polymerase factor sigma-54 [Pseudomonadota bacterium]MBU4469889.1 RNA polymerase factor sigma-54 [Pseudomonadota bacterium]MCG2751575.1 RNA polymerase factor sigma-54 [Desulfobacteraceae bacterium]